MSRDPASRDLTPATGSMSAGPGGREPTQSLHVEPGPEAAGGEQSDLARGTHNRVITRIESPGGRGKTPTPPTPPTPRRNDAPDDYLDRVLGSYHVLELLGKGGMGYVYRAEHTKLGREVALKLLRSDYASRRDAVARFFQEARTVNRARHRNIVDVTDFVELDDGTTYIIMELLTGTSLGAWARAGVDLPRALAVLLQICDGLAAAHAVGVVHRDLKPDNVIIVPTPDGAELVKLLDFGVAKLLNRDDEDVGFQTAAGSVIGTPAYMSPEQAGGMAIDARSDIYSLGAIMYELFSGQPMFRGRSFGEYVRKHLTEVPVPPRQTPGGAQLDPGLEAVILRCLEKDPGQRFGQITELRETLLQLFAVIEPASRQSTSSMAQLPRMPMPPRAYNLSGSGPRSPGASGAHPSFSIPSLADHPAHSTDVSSGGYSAQHAFVAQSGLPPAEPASKPTPGWLWFVGGALAVGLGITAAIWYAGNDAPDLSPRQAPHLTTQPTGSAAPVLMPPAPAAAPAVARPELIAVRFDSAPSGSSVYAHGRDAELCRTPCSLDIDLTDGGPADVRAFDVKHAGFTPGQVTVDLTGDQRAYSVALAPVTPDPEPAPAAPPSAEPAPRHVAKHPARPGTRRDASPASKPDPEPTVVDDAPPAPPPAPAAKKPKPAKIDPSDTLDPFRSP
ncbi:MAG TPA: serine/threonine-protein kinase [Kofleriaceae bacterium]|nr:serine/threonine-protein kinase [Kofleriaceae bacterium]